MKIGTEIESKRKVIMWRKRINTRKERKKIEIKAKIGRKKKKNSKRDW